MPPFSHKKRGAWRNGLRHYTPHGSWLTMAELGIGILSRQCLNRRIEKIEVMKREVKAWGSQPRTYLHYIQYTISSA